MLEHNIIKDNQGAEQGNSMGGGLFISHAPAASFTNNEIGRNLGTLGGRGVGGGVYLASEHAVVIRNAWADNTASIGGDGVGGGLALLASAATVMSNSISYNVASGGAQGLGGGLAIGESHTAQLMGNRFNNNLASGAGRGIGGGLYIAESFGLRVEHNTFNDNTAGAAPNIYGTGGGAYARDADDIVFQENTFERNLGSLYKSGLGGGLYLYHLAGARVQSNQFTANWAAVYAPGGAGGGGLGLGEVDGLTVAGNTFDRNVAALFTGRSASGNGGGIYAVVVRDSGIVTNTFTSNTGSWAGLGKGGGLSTSPDIHDNNTERLIVTGNTWRDNSGTTGTSIGDGGAIELRAVDSQIVRNQFEGNRACSEGCLGRGGTVYVHGWLLCRDITVDSNIFLDYQTQPSGISGDGILHVMYVDAYTITNNLLVGDADDGAGAVVLSVGTQLDQDAFSHSWVANNTIVGNDTSPGIFVSVGLNKDHLTVINNILVSHTVGIMVDAESKAQTVLSYNLFHGNGLDVDGAGVYTHTHPITGAAAFRDPAAHDYHLTVASAARDTGDPAGAPPAPDHDADGVRRPFGARVDIGAYEWHGVQVFMPAVRKEIAARVGWAIGDGNTGTPAIIGTTDGGRTWHVQKTAPGWAGLDAADISAVDEQTAWAAMVSAPGETRDAILHTRDGGATWVSQPLPAGVTGGVKSIKGLSRDEAWAATLGGIVLHTTDGGASWVVVSHPTAPMHPG